MSLNKLAKQISKKGRKGDTELVHMTRGEVAGLSALAKASTGKPLPRNPDTGLPEANILKQMLPTILGAAATFVGGPMAGAAVGAATGAAINPNDRWGGAALGAMGGFGGGQIAQGLAGAGANAAAAGMNAANTALPAAATNTLPAAGMSTATTALPSAVPSVANITTNGLSAVAQEGGKLAVGNASTITGEQLLKGATAAEKAGYAGQGFKSLGSMDGIKGFIGTEGVKGGAAQTGMGGGYNAMMAGAKAAAPMMMAPAQSGGGDEGYDGEVPEYRLDRGYTGGDQIPGSGFTSQRRWFNDEWTKLAEGGSVPPPPNVGNDGPRVTAQPALPGAGQGKPPEALWVMRPYGPGTSPGGMTGQSRDAFEYLMGRGSGRQQPAPPPPPTVAPPVAPPPPTVAPPVAPPAGGGDPGMGGGFEGSNRGGGTGMPMGGDPGMGGGFEGSNRGGGTGMPMGGRQ
ncbi:MAG: hypothetical protein ACRC1H_00730, partial [Caldilineaceae bacterium]